MKAVYTLVGLALLLSSAPEDSRGNEQQSARTVTVGGTGTVRAVPDSVQFMVGAMAHTMTDARKIELLSGGRCRADDPEAIIRRLVAFVAAGMRS